MIYWGMDDVEELEMRTAILKKIADVALRYANLLELAKARRVRFTAEDIHEDDASTNGAFDFAFAFSANLALYLDGLERGNHSVEAMLLDRGVIDKRTSTTDTEHGCFYIYFTDMKAGAEFVCRLNAFLDEYVAGKA